MDEHGTFEENLKSYKKLDASLDKLKGVNTLMTIKCVLSFFHYFRLMKSSDHRSEIRL
jgi:hypothetical protein